MHASRARDMLQCVPKKNLEKSREKKILSYMHPYHEVLPIAFEMIFLQFQFEISIHGLGL